MGGVPILPVYTTALGYWSVLYIEASHFFTHMGKKFIFSSTLKAKMELRPISGSMTSTLLGLTGRNSPYKTTRFYILFAFFFTLIYIANAMEKVN